MQTCGSRAKEVRTLTHTPSSHYEAFIVSECSSDFYSSLSVLRILQSKFSRKRTITCSVFETSKKKRIFLVA